MKERQMEKTDKKKGKRRNNRVKALKGEKERTGLNRFYEKKREKKMAWRNVQQQMQSGD